MDSFSPTPSPTEGDPIPPNDSEELKLTFTVYGSILLLSFLLFCWVRLQFPRAYTVRSWAESIKSPLAANQFGFISWTWNIISIDDDSFLEECGMDALCFARALLVGFKLSCLGMFNAIWLMPLYYTAEESDETDYIDDLIVEVSISHVPNQSPFLIAPPLASWMLFGYACYLILKELEWFAEKRRVFLSKPMARNYGVHVRNIPEEYRDNKKLEEFFRNCFQDPDAVLEAHVRVKAPKLEKKVAERDAMVVKLEHAQALKEVKGITPTHSSKLFGGEKLDSIDAYQKELATLNKDVEKRIDALTPESSKTKDIETAKKETSEEGLGGSTRRLAGSAMAMLSSEDGEICSAGFVAFGKLSACQTAQQIIHSHVPFTMEVLEAPDPEDIIWGNVGKTHRDLQVGKLISQALTAAACLLWTIPMGFFASLSSVDALKEEFEFLEKLLDDAPWLTPVFAQLAPLLVVIFNALLQPILTAFSMLEAPISLADVEGLLFSKLSAFMIIQTFFVSAISGGLFAALADFSEDPLSIINVLANALPSQSTYFIQLLFVSAAVGVALMEALRVVPLILAFVRGRIGPNLTEKERNTAFLGIRPLADPIEFPHAVVFSQAVLYFMVLFVYSVVAPITNFVLGFCFLFMLAVYRHHFVYVYPKRKDSGGKLFIAFISVLLACILTAQVTILGLLGLKQATMGAPLMIPLIIVQVLFGAYIKQMHFRVASNLPSCDSLRYDLQNSSTEEFRELDFVHGAYQQPELKAKNADTEVVGTSTDPIREEAPAE